MIIRRGGIWCRTPDKTTKRAGRRLSVTGASAQCARRGGCRGALPSRHVAHSRRLRWTNGNSGLPADLFRACSGPLDIEITTAGATQYLDEGVPLAA